MSQEPQDTNELGGTPPGSTPNPAPEMSQNSVVIICRGGSPFPVTQGGVDVYALRQAQALCEAGCDVILVGQGHLSRADQRPNLHFVPTSRTINYASRFRGAYFLKAFAASIYTTLTAVKVIQKTPGLAVVHCHHNSSVLILKLVGGMPPVVYTVHDPIFSDWDRQNFGREAIVRALNNLVMEKLATRVADSLLAVSQSIKSALAYWRPSKAACSVIQPLPSTSFTENLSSQTSMVDRRDYIITVGSLTGRKRVDLLLQALALCPEEMKLVVVGKGPARKPFMETALDLGLSRRVSWYDHVGIGELVELYRGARFAVVVSEREGFPTSIMEALEHGTPGLYISTRTPEVLDWGDYLRSSYLTEPAECAAVLRTRWEGWDPPSVDREAVKRWARTKVPQPGVVASTLLSTYNRLAGHP